MKTVSKTRNFVDNLRRYGLIGAIELYCYRIRETYRDWKLGIRTAGYIEADVLGHAQDCVAYQALNYRCLDIAFNHLQPDIDDVFLDYGCGKGRAVVTAATYPFGRVIGVELSAELSELAKDNVRRATRKLNCTNVEIVTADAADYEVPDDVTMILVFNPFTGNVLSAVQQQIAESLIRAPRRMRIIYMHPTKEPNAFHDCDWLGKSCELPSADWDDVNFMVYESRTAAECRVDDTMAAANVN
mgnify:CR=1 FL=1